MPDFRVRGKICALDGNPGGKCLWGSRFEGDTGGPTSSRQSGELERNSLEVGLGARSTTGQQTAQTQAILSGCLRLPSSCGSDFGSRKIEYQPLRPDGHNSEGQKKIGFVTSLKQRSIVAPNSQHRSIHSCRRGTREDPTNLIWL